MEEKDRNVMPYIDSGTLAVDLYRILKENAWKFAHETGRQMGRVLQDSVQSYNEW